MVFQIRSIIGQVGLALPSRCVMPSLLQGSHSQTEPHTHGDRVYHRIAGRAGRAVGEITGQCQRRESSKRNYYIISPRVIIKAIIIIISVMNGAWAQFIPLQLCSSLGL